MNTKKSILFICSGNIFRSMVAEYCFKKYLLEHNLNIKVDSAGITANKQECNKNVFNELLKRNIDVSNHIQRKLTKEILDQYKLIIVMDINHKRFIKEKFGRKSVLFNDICYYKNTPILDDVESLDTPTDSWRDVIFHIETVNYICKSIPLLVKNLNRYL